MQDYLSPPQGRAEPGAVLVADPLQFVPCRGQRVCPLPFVTLPALIISPSGGNYPCPRSIVHWQVGETAGQPARRRAVTAARGTDGAGWQEGWRLPPGPPTGGGRPKH